MSSGTLAEQAGPASPTESRSVPPTNRARLAGMLAAGVALGIAELVSSLFEGWQSLVVSVANQVIELAPGTTSQTAVETLGRADKPLLIAGTVLVCLGSGALVGPATARRPWVGPAAFAAFATVGALAGIDDELADDWGSVLTAAIAAGAGLTTLLVLLHAAVPARPSPDPGRDDLVAAGVFESPTDPHATRRAFFGWSAAAGAVAASSAGLARVVRGPSPAEEARRQVVLGDAPGGSGGAASLPTGLETDIEGLSPLITPNDDFYRIDTALLVPQVVPDGWQLSITGMVDRPLVISYQDLLDRATETWEVTLSCVSNEVGGNLVGTARWQGVALADLLDEAGIQPDASQVVGRSVDGWTAGFPTEVARDGRPAFVAVGMNGEPLPVAHGFPARLVVAGLYGYVSATKWLSEIEVTTWEAFDGYWIPRGWSKEGPILTQSRIDVPAAGSTLEAGRQAVAGVAWAGERGVSAVEVQVDDGEWRPARLGEELATTTWRQWVLDWDAGPGKHTLRVRSTDGTGDTQTGERRRPAPSGATGWDEITVTVR